MARLLGAASAIILTISGPLWAQVPPPGTPQPSPSAAFTGQRYPFPAPTPEDAYREGLINRWQLEQYQGPTPQALQGPSPNGGNRESGSGGGGGM
jgi:hypothetical protein